MLREVSSSKANTRLSSFRRQTRHGASSMAPTAIVTSRLRSQVLNGQTSTTGSNSIGPSLRAKPKTSVVNGHDDNSISSSPKSSSSSSTTSSSSCCSISPSNSLNHHKLRNHHQPHITNYFQVVKKSQRIANQRKPNANEEMKRKCIENGMDPDDGRFEVVDFGLPKGRGIVATTIIPKKSFVCEYQGELINVKERPREVKKREVKYERFNMGSYMYEFVFNKTKYCVDATEDDGSCGRLINHSCKKGQNCKMSIHVDDNGIPHLILVALRDILPGEELLYDYGDWNRSSKKAFPWLKT